MENFIEVDGPAIEYPHGAKEWYYNAELIGWSGAEAGTGYTQKQFEQWLKFKIFT